MNEKELNNPRMRAMFERSRRNHMSIFIISQDFYELPKKFFRADGKVYHIFKPNNLRDVQNLYQDEALMYLENNQFEVLSSTYLKKKYQPLTIDITRANILDVVDSDLIHCLFQIIRIFKLV